MSDPLEITLLAANHVDNSFNRNSANINKFELVACKSRLQNQCFRFQNIIQSSNRVPPMKSNKVAWFQSPALDISF